MESYPYPFLFVFVISCLVGVSYCMNVLIVKTVKLLFLLTTMEARDDISECESEESEQETENSEYETREDQEQGTTDKEEYLTDQENNKRKKNLQK